MAGVRFGAGGVDAVRKRIARRIGVVTVIEYPITAAWEHTGPARIATAMMSRTGLLIQLGVAFIV
jgi:hypothetical protein